MEKNNIENNVPKTWWDDFKEEFGNVSPIKEIIDLIEKAEENTNEQTVSVVIEAVESLSDKKYGEQKEKLLRRVKILEKRLDRSVSNDFGTFLRKVREDRGISVRELAEKINVSPSYINKLETGKRNAPTYPILAKLSKELQVDITNFLDIASPSSINKDEPVDLTECIFSDNYYILSKKNPELKYHLSTQIKLKLIDLISYIMDMEWDKNKHLDLLQIAEIIDEIKESSIENSQD